MPSPEFEKLLKIGRENHHLRGVLRLLEWDQETGMPPAAVAIRAEQIALMAGKYQKASTSKRFENGLKKLIRLKKLSDIEKAAAKYWRSDFLKAKRLPLKFVEAHAKLTSKAMPAWASARENDSFHQFSPYLERLFQMAREKAELLGYKEHPYDPLLDEFEPEMKTRELQELFQPIKKGLQPLLKKILGKSSKEEPFPKIPFAKEETLPLARLLLGEMGFSEEILAIGFSPHSFCTSFHPTDNRIGLHFIPNHLQGMVGAILHEGGHSLYEMGLPQEYFGSPLCDSISSAIHESQSRFWETIVGGSPCFWRRFLPQLAQKKSELKSLSAERLCQEYNQVQPTPIRILADEVTYNLHILLRFELEKALIDGSLKARDVPDAWNAKMKEYLGITPKNNAEGCLQDIHWSLGLIGYFPTYALGNFYAVQFFEAFKKDHLDWEQCVEKLGMLFIKDWLNKEIHCHGRRYSAHELVVKVTGKPLDSQLFLNYLRDKYL